MQDDPNWMAMYQMAGQIARQTGVSETEISEYKSQAVAHLYTQQKFFKNDGPATFTTWAHTVMRNRILQLQRQLKTREALTWSLENLPYYQRRYNAPSILDETRWRPAESQAHQPNLEAGIDLDFENELDFKAKWNPAAASLRPLERKIFWAVAQHPGATSDEIAAIVGARSGASVRVHLTAIRRKMQRYRNQED